MVLNGSSVWPYTLDGGAPNCGWSTSKANCLRTLLAPGLWEVPIYKFPGVRKKLDRPEPLKTFGQELEAKFNSNRAPVMVPFHPPYGKNAR